MAESAYTQLRIACAAAGGSLLFQSAWEWCEWKTFQQNNNNRLRSAFLYFVSEAMWMWMCYVQCASLFHRDFNGNCGMRNIGGHHIRITVQTHYTWYLMGTSGSTLLWGAFVHCRETVFTLSQHECDGHQTHIIQFQRMNRHCCQHSICFSCSLGH